MGISKGNIRIVGPGIGRTTQVQSSVIPRSVQRVPVAAAICAPIGHAGCAGRRACGARSDSHADRPIERGCIVINIPIGGYYRGPEIGRTIRSVLGVASEIDRI